MALVMEGPAQVLAAQRLKARGPKQLVCEPARHAYNKWLQGARRHRQMCLHDSIEVAQWLLVKHGQVDLFRGDASLVEHVVDGLFGKGGFVLAAGEPFFLGGGDHHAVCYQRGSGVVCEAGDPKNVSHRGG